MREAAIKFFFFFICGQSTKGGGGLRGRPLRKKKILFFLKPFFSPLSQGGGLKALVDCPLKIDFFAASLREEEKRQGWKRSLRVKCQVNLSYSVKQSNQNSSKMDIFHKPTTQERHV